jgi:lambda family phage portal protein
MSKRSARRRRRTERQETIGEDVALPTVAITSLPPYQQAYHTGDKWEGGFGLTQLLTADYWTLRARSAQLFETNLYARGLLRRLVTNEINTGLHLESIPEEAILGMEEESLAEWSETVENRYRLWAEDSWLCDHTEQQTLGAIQAQARLESLIEGDVLVVIRQYQPTGLPRVQLVSGSSVMSPVERVTLPNGSRICHGVELDSANRQVAYWVRQQDNTIKRMPAWGEKSGRRLAWLVYGTDKRLDDVRGKPMLALVMQSLKEIDRYRDSALRKAVINSMLAMFIKKTENKPSSKPISSFAMRKGVDGAVDSSGTQRSFRAAEMIPGLVLEELQVGEEPQGFAPNGTDEKFADFEEAMVCTIAWAYEVPPEILRLSFSNNYSASQAAINEFKMYLNRMRTWFGQCFCQPIYVEWLLAEALAKKIKAPGLVDAWRDSARYDEFAAWTSSDWAGHIKPAVDLSKLVRGYTDMVNEGFITRARAARELTGTRYSKNVQQTARENEQLARANLPLAELEAAKKPAAPAPPTQQDAGDDEGAAKDEKAA